MSGVRAPHHPSVGELNTGKGFGRSKQRSEVLSVVNKQSRKRNFWVVWNSSLPGFCPEDSMNKVTIARWMYKGKRFSLSLGIQGVNEKKRAISEIDNLGVSIMV
jgi:hypothetical protein